jgi:L,D-transpeptidase ErfK/SrfK
MIGELDSITTKYEDTLVHLARRYNVGFVELRAANPGVDPWLPGSGTRLTIPTQHILPDAPREGIVINLPEMRLYHYYAAGEAPATYPIGIGRAGLTTPLGSTTVERMATDPIWIPTERMRKEDPKLPAIVHPGPENPMGTHSLYLGWPSYAIHGTDKPYSIGRRLSSGCIRMYPEDILTLFDNVAPGTRVTVVDQPIKTAWIDDQFFIQVHPTQEQSDILSHDAAHQPVYPIKNDDVKLIMNQAGADADKLDWVKVRKAIRERRGVPLIVARRDQTPGSASAKAKAELVPEAKKPAAPATKPKEKDKDSGTKPKSDDTAKPKKPMP